MGARRPWNSLGSGFCYALMMMSERVGVKVIFVILGLR